MFISQTYTLNEMHSTIDKASDVVRTSGSLTKIKQTAIQGIFAGTATMGALLTGALALPRNIHLSEKSFFRFSIPASALVCAVVMAQTFQALSRKTELQKFHGFKSISIHTTSDSKIKKIVDPLLYGGKVYASSLCVGLGILVACNARGENLAPAVMGTSLLLGLGAARKAYLANCNKLAKCSELMKTC